jgi:hypothetical protein
MQIRDSRPRQFFWCDNVIIDHYARRLGPYALAVYMALLRHADSHTQSCFPSLHTLATELGMGKSLVIKAIEVLKTAKLISVKHRTTKAGDAASNLYLIRGVVSHADHGGSPRRPRVVSHTDTNKTQLEQHSQNKGEPGFLALQMNGAYGLCAACDMWHQPGPCPLADG